MTQSVQDLPIETEPVNCPSSRPRPEEIFEQLFSNLVHPGDSILDAGCSNGRFAAERCSGLSRCRITGLDLLETVGQNPSVDFRVCGNVNQLPFSANSFDVIYARWLVEHLENPEVALREFHRVLKPGGRLALFTTNLLHYYGGAAKFTPNWFHLWFNRRVRGFKEDDIFPTYYRANTRWRLQKLLSSAGFRRADTEVTLAEGAPTVLAFNSLLHRVGMAYEYLVKRFDVLSAFRMNLIAMARKE
ncbi:MAG TPA: class I SAM-dependent methyltransferase [Candidatus Acidoferrum sp.]|jgi:ubiquinone/menaquinone biosynthesis C-methylase UbiE